MASEAKQDAQSPPTIVLATTNAAGSPFFLRASKMKLHPMHAGLRSAHRIQTRVAVVVFGSLGMIEILVGSPFWAKFESFIENKPLATAQGTDESKKACSLLQDLSFPGAVGLADRVVLTAIWGLADEGGAK
jgi:hypothetical protein